MSKRVFGLMGVMALIIGFSACGSIEAPAAPPTAVPTENREEVGAPQYDGTILALGDSLTDGAGVDRDVAYPAQLARKLQADGFNYEVVNAGISGETSTGLVNRLDWMLQSEPDIVIIEIGGNDGLRGQDLDTMEANIDQVVAAFDAQGSVVVLAGMQMVENLGQEYTTRFAGIYPTIAEKYDVILIPFFLEGVATDPELNQPDFIHPTAEGYTVVVDVIYPYILEAIDEHQQP